MNYDDLADKGMAEASAEDRAMVAQPTPFKDAWAAKVSPVMSQMKDTATGMTAGFKERQKQSAGQNGAVYEDPRGVVANYNLGDLVKMYSAG